MTASPFDPASGLSSAFCTCSICTGQGDSQVYAGPSVASTGGRADANFPLSSIPVLNSNLGAAATIVLDFDGNTLPTWYTYTNVVTPVYDIDGDATTFSAQELENIEEIWKRVSEDYAPFNVNVTTVDPGVLVDKAVCKVAIGGAYTDWYGSSSGGVALLGSFYTDFLENVGFAFVENLNNGNAKSVAEAVSHEAGHMFGLRHQSVWNGNTLVAEYDQGDANWAPIMGVGYYSAVTTWFNGPTSVGPFAFQDDMSILSGNNNGFGYRTNSIGSLATAASLGNTGFANASGIIARNDDVHWYQFATDGGAISFDVNTIRIGANLDSVMEIRDSSGAVRYTSNPFNSLNSSLDVLLQAGTYYVTVRSTGEYGYVGQYTLTGLFPPQTPPPPVPEVTVLLAATDILDRGAVSFGTTTVGAFVDRTFTIRNDGEGLLVLGPVDTSNLPLGFSIVSNITDTELLTGETTTFTVRMTATAAGSFSGLISFINNDPNEAVFEIRVSGTVTGTSSQLTLSTIDNGNTGYKSSGAWTTKSGAGYGNDYSYAQATAATSIARWTEINLAPGTYRVAATWLAFAKAASNARFYFGDDTGTLGSKLVNQRVAPSGFSADGKVWQSIATVTITAGHTQLWVQLNNKNVNGFVVADAIRFERIGLPAPSLPVGAARQSSGALAQFLADEAMAQVTRKR